MITVRQTKTDTLRSDEEILQAYQAGGDQDELALLYMRYTDLVYGVALKYVKDPESAKDVTMNIYTELVEKLLLHPVNNFKSWLYTVTKNHCLMQLRKEKKTVIVDLQPGFMQSEDFEHLDNALNKEKELQKLEGCIEGLKEEQKTVIQLFYLQGKCYNEIVDITGHDWARIRSLVQNGRRNLKICMDQHE